METTTMIRQLRATAKKHEKDKLYTFDTNITAMCTDVANRLEKLVHYEELGLEPSEIAYLMNFYKERTTGKAIALDLKLLGDSFELERYKKLEEEGRLLQGCRCKNCKHVDYSGCRGTTVYCEYLERCMQEDDFCSRGEYDEQALAAMQEPTSKRLEDMRACAEIGE